MGRDPKDMHPGYAGPITMNQSCPLQQHPEYAPAPYGAPGQSMYRGVDPYALQGQRGPPPGPGGMRPQMPPSGDVRMGQESGMYMGGGPDGYYESPHRVSSMQGGPMG